MAQLLSLLSCVFSRSRILATSQTKAPDIVNIWRFVVRRRRFDRENFFSFSFKACFDSLAMPLFVADDDAFASSPSFSSRSLLCSHDIRSARVAHEPTSSRVEHLSPRPTLNRFPHAFYFWRSVRLLNVPPSIIRSSSSPLLCRTVTYPRFSRSPDNTTTPCASPPRSPLPLPVTPRSITNLCSFNVCRSFTCDLRNTFAGVPSVSARVSVVSGSVSTRTLNHLLASTGVSSTRRRRSRRDHPEQHRPSSTLTTPIPMDDDDSAKKSPLLLLPLLSKLPLPVAPARASARTRREPRDAPAFCARTFFDACVVCVRARALCGQRMKTQILGTL